MGEPDRRNFAAVTTSAQADRANIAEQSHRQRSIEPNVTCQTADGPPVFAQAAVVEHKRVGNQAQTSHYRLGQFKSTARTAQIPDDLAGRMGAGGDLCAS